MKNKTALEYWKENEARFPTLTHMAHDFLAIPDSTVDLECFFCWARDNCHYRRGRLLPKTIRAIMLYMISKNMEVRKSLASDNTHDTDDDDNDSDIDSHEYISDDESDTPTDSESASPHNAPTDSASVPSQDAPTGPASVPSLTTSNQHNQLQSPFHSSPSCTRKRQHDEIEDELNSTATQRPIRQRRVPEHPGFVSY